MLFPVRFSIQIDSIIFRRPSGNPKEDIRDHLHQVKLNQKRDLEFMLEVFATENNSLDCIMRNKHKEIERIKSIIDNSKQDLYKVS